MEIIHANENFEDINQIRSIRDFDAEISLYGNSDYKLTLPTRVYEKYPIEIDHIIYIPGTEFGGPVHRRVTSGSVVEIYGKTWRGLLNKNLIIPPEGEAYRVVSGNAQEVVTSLLGNHFGSLFTVLPSSVTLSDQFRYEPIGDGLQRMLDKAGAKLIITQVDSGVNLEIKSITDLSDEIEFSEDYGVLIKIDDDRSKNINHIVALGRGELTDRLVMQAWLLPEGAITYDGSHPQRPTGESEYTKKVDYPNAEDENQLKEAIKKAFTESKATVKTEMDISKSAITGDLGDIVSSRDRLTGLVVTQSIDKIVLKISDTGRIEMRYGVKE